MTRPIHQQARAEEQHMDIIILSGEGSGPGTREPYRGALTLRALRARLTRERRGGDRWAYFELAADDERYMSAERVYQRLAGEVAPACPKCLGGSVICDTCDDCGERHCSTCDACLAGEVAP